MVEPMVATLNCYVDVYRGLVGADQHKHAGPNVNTARVQLPFSPEGKRLKFPFYME